MSYSFTAASLQYLSVGTVPVAVAPLTISAWIDPAGVAGSNLFIASLTDTAAGNTRFAIFQTTTSVTANAHDGAAAGSSQKSTVSASAWQHVAGVFTSTTSRDVYLAGAVGTNNATSVTPASIDTTAIGARVNSSVLGYYDGLIAEVAFWDVALSAGNITSLAAGANPTTIGSPVAYWSLRSNPGLTDYVSGRVLTAVNTPTWSSDHPTVDGISTSSAGKSRLLAGVG